MNLKEYRDLLKTNKNTKEKKKPKYGNKITVVDGISFDSKKEAYRYLELKLLEKAGEIINLKRQVPYLLVPKQKGERKVEYIADFVYVNKSGEVIVEDSKGFRTDVYVVKRKLMKWLYPNIKFIES